MYYVLQSNKTFLLDPEEANIESLFGLTLGLTLYCLSLSITVNTGFFY